MAKLQYSTLSFQEKDRDLQVNLLRLFYTIIPRQEVEKIAKFSIPDPHTIELVKISQEKAETKFSFLLAKYFAHLKNKLTGNPATYIHRNSGIPLIGNVAFGIVYRNSSIIEIKPITSCNLNCIYCSISEGLSSKKHDFVVEKDYLVEELQKVIDFVAEPVEVHIGVQGEPFLYADIEDLFADLQAIKNVRSISIDTNGTMLSKEIINRISKYTKLQLNLSLDAIDEAKAKLIAGTNNYNVNQVKEVIAYASQKMKVIVAPVLTPGYNKEEMEKIIQFIKSLEAKPILGIQNFLKYKTGRIPAEEISWEKFYSQLEEWEKKYKIKLKLSKEDFNIRKTKEMPKPFEEGEVITAVLKCPDRFPNSSVAAAKGRNISVPGCPFVHEKKIQLRIVRDKHNIFVGKQV
ncbi:MAG: radical SAM protein [Nanoarchaeota archaeon]